MHGDVPLCFYVMNLVWARRSPWFENQIKFLPTANFVNLRSMVWKLCNQANRIDTSPALIIKKQLNPFSMLTRSTQIKANLNSIQPNLTSKNNNCFIENSVILSTDSYESKLCKYAINKDSNNSNIEIVNNVSLKKQLSTS